MSRRRNAPPPPAPRPARRHVVSLLIALGAGWAIMMLEILGGRLLAPYFGYSIYQWGALIGVVMAALAAGYYLGGVVGDGPHALTFLLWALVASTVFVLLVPWFGPAVLPHFRAWGPAWGAVGASAAVLGLPSVLLAAVSPIVIRLNATERVAETAGAVYAVSTVGSIGGTFFTAFWAIPALGTRLSYYVAGAVLVAAVIALGLMRQRLRYLTAVGLLLLAPAADPARPDSLIFEDESVHNFIQVVDHPSARYLFLNYQDGPQTVMPKHSLLAHSYYDYFLLGPLLSGGQRVLFLGAAGGTALKQLVAAYPDVEVVGVELDPAVVAVAKSHFDLAESRRLRLVAEDARWYLTTTRETFDVVAIDLYVTGHIPFYCTTREFFEAVRDRLSDRGVVMMNVLSIQPGEDLIAPFIRTVRAVFPSAFLIDSANFILIGTKAPLTEAEVRRALEAPSAPAVVREVAARALPQLRTATAGPEWPIFTDDRNDVEFRTFRMFYGQY